MLLVPQSAWILSRGPWELSGGEGRRRRGPRKSEMGRTRAKDPFWGSGGLSIVSGLWDVKEAVAEADALRANQKSPPRRYPNSQRWLLQDSPRPWPWILPLILFLVQTWDPMQLCWHLFFLWLGGRGVQPGGMWVGWGRGGVLCRRGPPRTTRGAWKSQRQIRILHSFANGKACFGLNWGLPRKITSSDRLFNMGSSHRPKIKLRWTREREEMTVKHLLFPHTDCNQLSTRSSWNSKDSPDPPGSPQ